MTRMLVAGLVVVAGFVASAPRGLRAGRAVRDRRQEGCRGRPMGQVVRVLEAKHKGKVFAYDKSPEDVRRDVGAYHPRYVCFVCEPTKNFPDFALVANKFLPHARRRPLRGRDLGHHQTGTGSRLRVAMLPPARNFMSHFLPSAKIPAIRQWRDATFRKWSAGSMRKRLTCPLLCMAPFSPG